MKNTLLLLLIFLIDFNVKVGGAGFIPTELKTEAQLKMENIDGHFKVISIHLVLEGIVPNISQEQFDEIANNAKKNCPVSQALSAIEITLTATLKN